MFPNAKGSELVGVVGNIPAQAVAGASVTSGWISMSQLFSLLALIEVAALGASASVAASISQAIDNQGTSAKALKSIAPITSSNQIALADVLADSLDGANGFSYVQLTLTVTGASSIVGAKLLATTDRYYPASSQNISAVSQIV